VLHNLHTAVFADDDPGCAAGGSFINASAGMSPNFDVESPAVHGAFHTSFKNFEHVVVGGIRAAVGLRAEYKDLSSNDYIVEYPFTRLVPEGDETVTFLLSDVTSDMTDPGNPGSVPISGTQRAALLATPVGGGQTLGDLELGDLSLKIAICEQSKTILPFPLPSTNSGGTVSHDVVLQVTIEKAGVPILTEYYDATFVGDLLLSKVPKQDSTELRTIRATLSSLSTIVSGLDWSAVTSSVPFSSAPVSLFLRAVFGDHGIPATSADQRVFYLVEGMTGPLVERSAHGMVVLPGLDFPAYNGPVIADQLSAHGFYDDDYQLGFKFDRPRLCASVARWGEAPGLLNGVPSGLLRNRTLVVEVDWNESSNLTQTERKMMLTNVTGDVAIAASPYAVSNPSRYDSGHLLTDYEPVIGDESRVSDMSGHRFGAFLPGGGRHWVAATPAGYAMLRQNYSSSPSLYADTTFELRPYKAASSNYPCDYAFPTGPIVEGGSNGLHHENAPEDIFEALTFETRLSCKGGGDCDGVRLVARWTAPLFQDCTEPHFGKDQATFVLNEGTLRAPPTTYGFQILPGCLGGGGGSGPGPPGGHDH
jgi:hypothetical protein